MSAAALEDLLAESPQDAAERADRAFDALAGARPLVLYGAGRVGRRVLAALRAERREPVCFADAGAGPGAPPVDGMPVLGLAEAADRHGADAVFVVTILNPRFPQAEIARQLRDAGCRHVTSWIPLGWRHPAALLPHYAVDRPEGVLRAAGDVRAAHALLGDEASRAEYVAQVAWRLTGDFGVLPQTHRAVAEQYFSPDVLALRDDELFVDCGAFDGDTIATFLAASGGRFDRYVALEPEPANLGALRARLATLAPAVRARVDVLPFAAAAQRGTLRFSGGGASSAAATDDGEVMVQAAPLDELLAGRGVTYLKMDIEGAEPGALHGAAATVRRERPILAVCAYHAQDHLWRLPLAVAGLVGDGYRYSYRRYEPDCWELVLYAVPEGRSAPGGVSAGRSA
jgi:FkbM family methyltransferase